MICVECGNPDVPSLHTKTKSQYVQLTVCSSCGKVADRYVEYDNVIVFLDILLLLPQAYRHVAYNVVEEQLFQEEHQGFFERYRRLSKFVVLTILFDVYLKWACQERHHVQSELYAAIISLPPTQQYFMFMIRQLTEKIVFFSVIMFGLFKVLRWGHQQNKNLPPSLWLPYHVCVILTTVLMSMTIKSLPMIMLIWPYDNALVASTVVDVLAVFSTMEALRMNTGCSYKSVGPIVVSATVLLVLSRQFIVSFAAQWLIPTSTPYQIWYNQAMHLINEAKGLIAFE